MESFLKGFAGPQRPRFGHVGATSLLQECLHPLHLTSERLSMPALAWRGGMDFDVLHAVNAVLFRAKRMPTILRWSLPAEAVDLQLCLRVSPSSVCDALEANGEASIDVMSNVALAINGDMFTIGDAEDDVVAIALIEVRKPAFRLLRLSEEDNFFSAPHALAGQGRNTPPATRAGIGIEVPDGLVQLQVRHGVEPNQALFWESLYLLTVTVTQRAIAHDC
mmetsp:Transcript_33501/g.76534  ORF Transcript_33501/g.76534 Transcript_33501/m.76534 type:complete len:221 (-) Transcript_33501:383-1045(-)